MYESTAQLETYLTIEVPRGRIVVRDSSQAEQCEGRGIYAIEMLAWDMSAGVLTTRDTLPEAMDVARTFGRTKGAAETAETPAK